MSGRTDELRYLPNSSSGVRLFSWLLRSPRFPSMCCTESEDSIELNSENLFQLQPVFFFFLPHVFLIEIRCTAYCH